MNLAQAISRQFGAAKSITKQQNESFSKIRDEMKEKGLINYFLIIEFEGNKCLASADSRDGKTRIDIGKEIFPVAYDGSRMPARLIPIMTEWLCIIKTI